MATPKQGYWLEGQRLPSVTTVLSRFKDSGGLIHWAWSLGKEGKDYREERDKRLRPDGNAQYVEPRGRFARFLDDPFTTRVERPPCFEEVTVAFPDQGIKRLLHEDIGMGWREQYDNEESARATWLTSAHPREGFKDFLTRKGQRV